MSFPRLGGCAYAGPGKELDRTRLIVTACPHKDRSALAMVYLKTQGFDVKYLEDGLLGLAELLRGDKAKELGL